MCGISGWIRPDSRPLSELVRMTRAVSHRGPDGEGYWVWDGSGARGEFVDADAAAAAASDHRAAVALGHRRLAILDLTDAGLQPMSSADGRLWIVFNGEIYNYRELRAELAALGHRSRTQTDTEVILAAYEQWGTDCFARFNGMWGLAIVDLRRRTVVLSRDRLGIKPLYTRVTSEGVAFASEIKQFAAITGGSARGHVNAILQYIETGHDVGPATLWEDVQAFPAGHWGEVKFDQPTAAPTPRPFWFPENVNVSRSRREDIRAHGRELFRDAVKLCLRSDVPVGVCLSGGLDSAALYGQAQQLGQEAGHSIGAFSAAFHDRRFDERPYVDIVLRRWGGQGHNCFPIADEFLDDVERWIYHHDEPPATLSQYAAWSVMRLARSHDVPVLLNGQGGDELFAGYWSAYYLFFLQTLRRSPQQVVKHLVGCLLPGGNPTLVSQLLPHCRQFLHRVHDHNRDVLLPRWRAYRERRDANWAVVAQRMDPVAYRLHEVRHVHLPRLLKWDDRNSMAFSIEGRYPFLDHRLVEWALSLPPEANLSRGWNKLVLREMLTDVLPKPIQWRRSKIGFETPQSEWVRTSLRPVLLRWAARPSERLCQFIAAPAVKALAEALAGSRAVDRKDERQLLLLRLFFLDHWLNRFAVDIDERVTEPSIETELAPVGPHGDESTLLSSTARVGTAHPSH